MAVCLLSLSPSATKDSDQLNLFSIHVKYPCTSSGCKVSAIQSTLGRIIIGLILFVRIHHKVAVEETIINSKINLTECQKYKLNQVKIRPIYCAKLQTNVYNISDFKSGITV